MVTCSIVHSFLALRSSQLHTTLLDSLSDFGSTAHTHLSAQTVFAVQCANSSHRWELIKSVGHSMVTTIALGQLWKTFNKMPIELLNGNERFVVFNISKIMPGGTRARARAHSQTQPQRERICCPSNALQYYYLCEFLPMFRLTTYRDIIIIHAATCAVH